MINRLHYKDSDGLVRVLSGCSLTQDKVGRYWLWCDKLEHNLAFKIKTKEDCLIAAIDSLLFTIQLRDERIASLQRIATLAQAFADEIKQDKEDDF